MSIGEPLNDFYNAFNKAMINYSGIGEYTQEIKDKIITEVYLSAYRASEIGSILYYKEKLYAWL